MVWENENGSDVQKWPTWSTRRNWARNNYLKYGIQWKLQKFLVMLANLTVLNDLIEEEGGEVLLTPKQRREWKGWYESFRPTHPVGRPKSDSGSGRTE
jgi:hypothetical protein